MESEVLGEDEAVRGATGSEVKLGMETTDITSSDPSDRSTTITGDGDGTEEDGNAQLTPQETGQDWPDPVATDNPQHSEVTGERDEAMETGELESLPPLPTSPSVLPNQEDIVAFAERYSVNLASKRFDVSIGTIKKWMKSSSVSVTAKYNTPGQGRKVSYSPELDHELADHIRDQMARGEKVTLQGVCLYARNRIQEEIPGFVASTGWANRFLARHNIDLSEHRDRMTPQRDTRSPDSRGRPLSYSVETDQVIANYVRQKLSSGYNLSNSELRRYAKELISKENKKFTGSASWAQNFLHRHKISLQSGDTKDTASTSPSPTVASRVSPASPSTPLLPTTPLLASSQTQYPATVLTSSPHFTDVTTTTVSEASHINPSVDMHIGHASSSPGFQNPALPEGVMSLPPAADYSTDDPIKQALALLLGENIDPAMLTADQMAALQSTLSELSTDTVPLVELLNAAQQLNEQQSNEVSSASVAANLASHGLYSAASNLYLGGLTSSSDAFSSGLTGAAATQVNPNTQTPTIPNPPRTTIVTDPVLDPNHTYRPLSYAKETDAMLAKWVLEQQAAGKKVTFASLRTYAKNLVSTENPNFNASVGWVTPFLLRHGLDLSINKNRARQTSDSAELEDEQSPLTMQSPTQQTSSSSSHHIVQEEHQLGAEPMMVPIQVITQATGTSDESPAIPTSCSQVATLEGIRAVLEHNLTASGSDHIQLASHLPEQSLGLSQTHPTLVPTSLQQHSIPVSTADNQSVGEEVNTTSTKQGFTPEKPQTPAMSDEDKLSVKKRAKGQRNRHRLSEKLDVVRLMREHNLAPHYVCRMLGIANSTLAGWIKLIQQKGSELEALSVNNKKRSNLSGQGRPLTYSREKDEAIARWVQTQQKHGVQVMPAELAKYAQSVIREENRTFTASSGWAQKFLQRHGLQLAGKVVSSDSPPATGPSGMLASASSGASVVQDQREIPAAIQTEEVIAHEYSQERPYPEDTEKHLVSWTKDKVASQGTMSLQELCRYAELHVIPQNPMFVASLGWAFMFLYTHGIILDPKPNVGSIRSTPNTRKRTLSARSENSEQLTLGQSSESLDTDGGTPKRPHPDPLPDTSVSPSTSNLCEALLDLSSSQEPSASTVQAVLQVALRALHQQQQQKLQEQQIQLEAQQNIQQELEQQRMAEMQQQLESESQQNLQQELQQKLQQEIEQQLQLEAQQQRLQEETQQKLELDVQQRLQEEAREKSLEEAEQNLSQKEQGLEQMEEHPEQPLPELEVQMDSLVKEAEVLVKEGMTGKEKEAVLLVSPLPGTSRAGTPKNSTPKSKNTRGRSSIGAAALAAQDKEGSSNTYFGKSAREFSLEEKEEVVRYANATTLQKAAMKYGVAAPTVWRWRVELKLHQPKYSAMQKKYIIKFAETNSLKEAAQRYGITGKTITNWRKALQADGELTGDVTSLMTQSEVVECTNSGDSQSSEVMFHFVVDGDEVVDVTGTVAGGGGGGGVQIVEETESPVEAGIQGEPTTPTVGCDNTHSEPLEVTTDMDIENVGMEYDVVSSEGHVAKPRCTPQEKVQILQYALDHSIKEASQKFGISPGTLYYWKRSRHTAKESCKERPGAGAGGGLQLQQQKTSPGLEVSDSGEALLTDPTTSTVDTQTSAAIQNLSQAIAGMPPSSLQQLNPDLTLLQAVSTLLAGGAGDTGADIQPREGGDKENKTDDGKRRDSDNSEGISSPTDVLVRPFPPPLPAGGGSNEPKRKENDENQNQIQDTPQVVSEEVITIGPEDVLNTDHEDGESSAEKSSREEKEKDHEPPPPIVDTGGSDKVTSSK